MTFAPMIILFLNNGFTKYKYFFSNRINYYELDSIVIAPMKDMNLWIEINIRWCNVINILQNGYTMKQLILLYFNHIFR